MPANLSRQAGGEAARAAAERDDPRAREQEHHQPGTGAGGLASRGVRSTSSGRLRSEDTRSHGRIASSDSASMSTDWDKRADLSPSDETSESRLIPARNADLFVANSGTTMRFLTAMRRLGQADIGWTACRGCANGRSRTARRAAATRASERASEWTTAARRSSLKRGSAAARAIRGDVSSQFLSGLLMAAPFARDTGDDSKSIGTLVSKPYVAMTMAMMKSCGGDVNVETPTAFSVVPRRAASARSRHIRNDRSPMRRPRAISSPPRRSPADGHGLRYILSI